MGFIKRQLFSRSFRNLDRRQQVKSVFVSVAVLSGLAFLMPAAGSAATVGADAPKTPPANICGSSILNGTTSAPKGAITVPAGNNSGFQANPGATYWFAPGVHTLGTGQYSQIIPAANDTFLGGISADGTKRAAIDGQNLNDYAFTQTATGVTIKNLEIRNFGQPPTYDNAKKMWVGGNQNQGVVNHDSGHNWTMTENYIHDNHGAAMMVGAFDTVSKNCLTKNGQYAFNAYEAGVGPEHLTVTDNEISFNNTDDWENKIDGCGCTGGGKFWKVNVADVTGNYVHGNQSVGLWADTNNTDINFEGNYVSDNWYVGIFYEISYNARIADNTLLRNGIIQGAKNTGFPVGAIYLSESGGDSRVKQRNGAPGRYKTIEITGNVFTDNWSGVVDWENADRFCGNSVSTDCTLVNPTVADLAHCEKHHEEPNPNDPNNPLQVPDFLNKAPYKDDCRWKTQNVNVTGNVFSMDTKVLTDISVKAGGPACQMGVNACGLNAIFSNSGSWPAWSAYKGEGIRQAITFSQHNVFDNNVYSADNWKFMPVDQAHHIASSAWQAAPFNQDKDSSFDGKGGHGTSSSSSSSSSSTTNTTGTTIPKYTGRYCRDTGTVQAVQSTSNQSDPGEAEFHFVKVAHASCPNMDYNGPAYILVNGSNPDGGMQILPVLAQGEHGKSGPQSLAGELRAAAANGKPVEIQANGTGDWVERKTVSAATAKALAAQLEK